MRGGLWLAALAVACVSCSEQSPYALLPAAGSADVPVDTHLRITFPATPQLSGRGMIRIKDLTDGVYVDSLDLSIPAGPTERREYGPECGYTPVPYDYSRTSMPTNRTTRPGTPSGVAEPTPPEYQLNIIGGFTDAFHFYPVIVRGCEAEIYPHNNVLAYGHRYEVTVDSEVFDVDSIGFDGIAPGQWTFSVRNQAPQGTLLTVDAGGKGDFCTVQGALDHLPDFATEAYTIRVAAGDYEELVYARNKSHVTLEGAGMGLTRVHYANCEVFNPHPLTVKTNEYPGTFPSRRAAFMLDNCSDIALRHMTIATDMQGQAEGLLLNGERMVLDSIHIIGSGDALQANGSIYMQYCEMDGGGDTFLGRGALYAYRCNLRNDGGPFTWVRNTKASHGDVFVECTFSTTNGRPVDFGRCPAQKHTSYPDAEQVLIDCKARNVIPSGWSAICAETCTFLEFNTRDMDTDELLPVDGRHPYSRQLDAVKDKELIEQYRDRQFVVGF